MRAQLKKSIITAIKNNATDFTDAGYDAVKHFDWDRQQWQEEPEKTEHPFLRPAVFIKVEDYEFETRAGRRYAAIPITLTIVQDYYVDARERSATQQDAYDKSNYSEILNGILDSQQLDCLAKLELTGEGNEEEYGNQLVDTLNYTAHVYQKRNATGKLVTCLPATAILKDSEGVEIQREQIASGGEFTLVCPAAGDAIAVTTDNFGKVINTTNIPAGETQEIVIPESTVQVRNTDFSFNDVFNVRADSTFSRELPDITITVKDQNGNILASEIRRSAIDQEVIVNI